MLRHSDEWQPLRHMLMLIFARQAGTPECHAAITADTDDDFLLPPRRHVPSLPASLLIFFRFRR